MKLASIAVPSVGQRVRRTAAHPVIPLGMLGTIDVVHSNGRDFWVCTDGTPECGAGFNGWTTFDEWTPLGAEA